MDDAGTTSTDRPGEAAPASPASELALEDGLLEVRATIHLAGLGRGELAMVDPSEVYVADCIRAGYLVPVSPDSARE